MARAPFHVFPMFYVPVLHTIFFPGHWLLSHITIAETMDTCETGLNPVAITIINALERILAQLGIEPVTFCTRVLYN